MPLSVISSEKIYPIRSYLHCSAADRPIALPISVHKFDGSSRWLCCSRTPVFWKLPVLLVLTQSSSENSVCFKTLQHLEVEVYVSLSMKMRLTMMLTQSLCSAAKRFFLHTTCMCRELDDCFQALRERKKEKNYEWRRVRRSVLNQERVKLSRLHPLLVKRHSWVRVSGEFELAKFYC